ncbi:hypothetical protein L6452_44483 [Arctium lappa]|uniref:Uncharacterized protein n=1 Tax=Arctium lappa TaxID=4217 RepID=A0ACB8XFR7_ARCLA|nr:hypothetical protein L6452_44483 [Arctium lappa]
MISHAKDQDYYYFLTTIIVSFLHLNRNGQPDQFLEPSNNNTSNFLKYPYQKGCGFLISLKIIAFLIIDSQFAIFRLFSLLIDCTIWS